MIKSYADRSAAENRYWFAGSKDCLSGRKSRYDALVGAGCPYVDYYLDGWKAPGETAEEFDRLHYPAREYA